MDIDAMITILVGHKGTSDSLMIKVVAHLKADYEGDTLEIFVSPIELRHLLNMPNMSLNDLSYYTDPARQDDVWASLISNLYIVDGHVNEYGDPEPREIALTMEKSAADRVEGAITTARALAVAQELMSVTHVTSHLKLSVDKGEALFLNLSKGDDEGDATTARGLSEEKGVDSEEEEKEKDEDITKIVIDHTHDAPPNIGLLVDRRNLKRLMSKWKWPI